VADGELQAHLRGESRRWKREAATARPEAQSAAGSVDDVDREIRELLTFLPPQLREPLLRQIGQVEEGKPPRSAAAERQAKHRLKVWIQKYIGGVSEFPNVGPP
jgi:hypothetical protein